MLFFFVKIIAVTLLSLLFALYKLTKSILKKTLGRLEDVHNITWAECPKAYKLFLRFPEKGAYILPFISYFYFLNAPQNLAFSFIGSLNFLQYNFFQNMDKAY